MPFNFRDYGWKEDEKKRLKLTMKMQFSPCRSRSSRGKQTKSLSFDTDAVVLLPFVYEVLILFL